MRDENNELPGNFLSELYKWALECKHFKYMRIWWAYVLVVHKNLSLVKQSNEKNIDFFCFLCVV